MEGTKNCIPAFAIKRAVTSICRPHGIRCVLVLADALRLDIPDAVVGQL